MYVEKETDKALLLVHNAVPFWIQKRWMKNGKLLPAGWKAYRDAEKKHWEHFNFDVTREFEKVRETEKAMQLRCIIVRADGRKNDVLFWLPKSMTHNWDFVLKKIQEVEDDLPYVGHVMWSGSNAA